MSVVLVSEERCAMRFLKKNWWSFGEHIYGEFADWGLSEIESALLTLRKGSSLSPTLTIWHMLPPFQLPVDRGQNSEDNAQQVNANIWRQFLLLWPIWDSRHAL